jgi:hypothetical protein
MQTEDRVGILGARLPISDLSSVSGIWPLHGLPGGEDDNTQALKFLVQWLIPRSLSFALSSLQFNP